MAELPKPQQSNAQLVAPAAAPTYRFESSVVAARGLGNIGDALDRMAQSLAKEQESAIQKEAAQYAIDKPLTAEQWNRIRKDPDALEKYFAGQGRVFKDTFMAAQASQLSSELQVRLENNFDLLKKQMEAGNVSPAAAIAATRDLVDGAVPAVSSMSPEVGLKFKANVAMRGAGVYEKAQEIIASNIKVDDKLANDTYIINMPKSVNDDIDGLIRSGIPVDINELKKKILAPSISYASKHRDIAAFYDPASKAFRQAIVDRVINTVTSREAVDNPEIVQKALQSNSFDIEVDVAGNKKRFNLQAEWNFLTSDEKKEIREQFNTAFNNRYNIITKSAELGGKANSVAASEAAVSYQKKLGEFGNNTPGVNGATILDFRNGKITEFTNVSNNVKNPDILTNAKTAFLEVDKRFISDFVTTMTKDQEDSFVLGKPLIGPKSAAINHILSSADLETRVALRTHFQKELIGKNELIASRDRIKEDERRDKSAELVQTAIEFRGKPKGTKALAELKTVDAAKWQDLTKSFSSARTQDDRGTITKLNILRLQGRLTPDILLQNAGALTVNTFEQYVGITLSETDKGNNRADEKLRNIVKYPREAASIANPSAATIEAQNNYSKLSNEFSERYLANRRLAGTKDYKPWDADAEMDKLIKANVGDMQKKSRDNARQRVDSFKNNYITKEPLSDEQVRTEIKLKLSGQKSKIKQAISNRDLEGALSDIDAAKGQ
jgi:hypothetical protein